MEVIEERFEDASEEHDYYYAGVILWIGDGRVGPRKFFSVKVSD